MHLLAPGSKGFDDIPNEVTADFLVILDDYCAKYQDMDSPEKEGLVKRIKDSIIAIQDAVILTKDATFLDEAHDHTQRLRQKLIEMVHRDEVTAFDSFLAERIEATLRRSPLVCQDLNH